MQYTLTISQTKALEWGLNAQQALLFSFVYECPSWAKPIANEDGVFFALSKAKIVEELPLLTDKPDTAYRLLKQLEAAGVVELSHTPGITLVRLTDKGKEWNKALDGSEKYAEKGRKNIRGTSEKYPTTLGNISEPGSEKSPTNQDTSNQDTNQGTSHIPAGAEQDALFDRFWNLYPRKIRKADARKAWAKLKVTDHLFGQIIDGLARYCASAEWLKDGGRFVPHAPTWLNGSRWEDEVGEAAEAGAPADSEAPVDRIIDLYHRACPNLTPVSVKTDKTLRAMIEERWSESPEHQSGDDFWVPFFLKANNRNQVYYRGQNIAPRLEALVSRAVFREIAEAQQ